MNPSLSDQLDENELNLLASAIPRIAILVGGADGDFDSNERAWAEKLVHIRSFNSPSGLEELYDLANTQFTDHMEELFGSYPSQPRDRNEQIARELAPINDILAKLDPSLSWMTYKSLRSFAWHIARTSGGFLGFGSISQEEEYWVGLPFLRKVEAPDGEEE
ncbi:MAG: hypothetical protein J5I41_09735 [Saprospiraceae bacterium]|nr:hypothetical protein [Saprospiraceae bacterium]